MRVQKHDEEYRNLCGEVPPDTYRIYRHPFPEWMVEPGRFRVNRAVVASFQCDHGLKIETALLGGRVFEIYYIRDDLRDMGDAESKEININHRVLAKDSEGRLYTHDLAASKHSIPTRSSSAPVVERTVGLQGLSPTGPVARLTDRGFQFFFEGR